jgi:hypothetical protein
MKEFTEKEIRFFKQKSEDEKKYCGHDECIIYVQKFKYTPWEQPTANNNTIT